MTAYEKLRKKYELEASLGELKFRQEELRERIPELKYQKREAEEKILNASGGLRGLLNRIAGKGEEDVMPWNGRLESVLRPWKRQKRICRR